MAGPGAFPFGPYTNGRWAFLPLYGGYITDIHINSPDSRLPDVSVC